ncbi:MAG: hypothetical protein QGH60_01250 [Phycisphaerae bacterium]|jgi:MFS family permease|nr:hypothetical protein [Phycisphaerae bacterium]
MDLARQLAIQIPIVIVSVTLLIAAAGKAGKERGAILIVMGAIGMCVMSVAGPLLYGVIMPRLIDIAGSSNISNIYLVLGLAVNILWSVPILLIAIGTFQRPTPAVQHKPYHPYPNQPGGPPEL